MIEANYDEVICPNCVTQFRAIPVNVQDQITALTAERDEWKARCEFSFEQRDKLTAERDALKDAARLALDASQKFVNKVDAGLARSKESYEDLKQVIAALKAVL